MSRANKNRCEAICSLLLVGLFTIGLAASAAIPVLAGSGSFNRTGSMNVAGINHTATLLANGLVLMAGGINAGLDQCNTLTSAELYNVKCR